MYVQVNLRLMIEQNSTAVSYTSPLMRELFLWERSLLGVQHDQYHFMYVRTVPLLFPTGGEGARACYGRGCSEEAAAGEGTSSRERTSSTGTGTVYPRKIAALPPPPPIRISKLGVRQAFQVQTAPSHKIFHPVSVQGPP